VQILIKRIVQLDNKNQMLKEEINKVKIKVQVKLKGIEDMKVNITEQIKYNSLLLYLDLFLRKNLLRNLLSELRLLKISVKSHYIDIIP
jgi:hypothetical protein